MVTTYLTLNGTLVGAYSYQKGNEASTGKITFIHTNYLGTPVIETDDKGDIVQMDITDVFGNYVQRDQRNDNAYHNKGYTGHEYDDTTNLTYARARYLDQTAHSFLSVDPVIYSLSQSYLLDPQQMNSYAYARNNPVIYYDPTGLYNITTGAVEKGDTVSGIVKQLNSTWGTSYTVGGFASAFSISNPNLIKTGQKFQVQAPSTYQQYSNGVSNALFNPGQAYSNFTSGNATAGQKAGTVVGGIALPLSYLGGLLDGGTEAKMAIGATGKLGENYLKTLGGESQVFKRTSLGGRFIDQLVGTTANESKVGYTTLTKTTSRQIAKDAELLQNDPAVTDVVWHFFQSPVTGQGGASGPLIEALQGAGIKYILH